MKTTAMRFLSAMAISLGAVFTVCAETWYCTKDDTLKNNRAFTNESYWVSSTGTAMTKFSADDEYYAYNTMYLQVAPAFSGGLLHLGSVSEDKSATVWLYSGNINTSVNGCVLEKGGIYCNRSAANSAHNLLGPVRVASPESSPFRIVYRQNSATFYLPNKVTGEDDKALLFNGNGKTGVNCLISDVTEYYGHITVTTAVENSSSSYEMKLLFRENFDFPGSLLLTKGTVLQMNTTDKSKSMTISNMTFRSGSRIVIGGAAAEHGSFTASGSLTAESDVEILLDFAVPISIEEQRFVLLSAPEDGADFEKDDFVLNASKSDWKHHCRLDTVVENGVKSLVAVFDPIVQQIRSYPKEYEFGNADEHKSSSMTNAAYWSDGQTPHGGAHYWTTTNVRTPYQPSTEVFPGLSLTLDDGGVLRVFHGDYTVTNMIVNSGTLQFGSGCDAFHCEKILVKGKTLSFETYLGNVVEIDSEISGDGRLWFCGIKRDAGTSSPAAHYVLRIPNEDFLGTVCVSQFITRTYYDFQSKFQTLRIADGRCLGGKLPQLNPAALTLANNSRLRTIEPRVELKDGYNRGVYIQGCGRFFVDKADGADTLVCNWPIAMNGAMYKEGDGTLELGGTVSFQGDEAIGDTPRANSNLFFVSKGTLVPRRHDCCNGMAVSFAENTKLIVPVDPDNEDLMKYGLYNVKEGGSVAIAGELAVDFDLAASVQPPAAEFTVGLVTVANTAAAVDAVRGRLKISGRTYEGYRRASLVEIPDAGHGTITFAAKFVQDGLSIIVR